MSNSCLRSSKPPSGRLPSALKTKSSEHRLRRNDLLRRRRQRNHDVLAGLVAGARDGPDRAAVRQFSAAHPAASPRRVRVSSTNRTKAPNGPLSCSAAGHRRAQFLVGSIRARARSEIEVRRPPRTSGETKSERAECQLSRVRNAREHTIGPHRPVVVGNMIEHAGVLATRDPGDGLPAQDAGAQQIQIAAALADGAQPGAFAAQIFAGDGAQGVALGRQLLLARPLLGGAGIAARSWPGAAPWWRAHCAASQRQRGAQFGAVGGLALVGADQARPRVSLRCKPRNRKRTTKDFFLLGNTTTRNPAQPGSETS